MDCFFYGSAVLLGGQGSSNVRVPLEFIFICDFHLCSRGCAAVPSFFSRLVKCLSGVVYCNSVFWCFG